MDIREILNSLSETDQTLYAQHRVEMRRSYLTAHNTVLGIVGWNAGDDMFMDYVDITLAMLFDRAGKIDTALTGKPVVHVADLEKIEKTIDEVAPKSPSQKMLEQLGKPSAQDMKANPWPQ
jgi:hypothetical protein